jgi:predicted SAM-dependent methyltransferase
MPSLRSAAARIGVLRNAAAGVARLRRAAREVRLSRRDRAFVAGLQGRDDLRLNVGSSSSHLEGWINLDLDRDPEERCVRLDATQRWPFRDGSAVAINSEHFLEHVSRDRARTYLAEAYRVLRPGGVIRTSTPDLRALAAALLAADPHDLDLHRSHGYTAETHGDLVNNYVYSFGHRRLYDEATLQRELERAGFAQVTRAAYSESVHPELRGIDRHDPGELAKFILCVDAVKPRREDED